MSTVKRLSKKEMLFDRSAAEIIETEDASEVEINLVERDHRSLLDEDLSDEDRDDEREQTGVHPKASSCSDVSNDKVDCDPAESTADRILKEARLAMPIPRKTQRQNRGDHRKQRIIQEALSSKKSSQLARSGETKLRSTKEVLRLVGRVLPNSTNHEGIQENVSNVSSDVDVEKEYPQQQNSLADSSVAMKPLPPKCLSPTVESDVGSVDDFERAVEGLPSKLSQSHIGREDMLNKIDGIASTKISAKLQDESVIVKDRSDFGWQPSSYSQHSAPFSLFGFLLGPETNGQDRTTRRAFSPLACGSLQNAADVVDHINPTASITESPKGQTTSHPISYAETVSVGKDADLRMPEWISSQTSAFEEREEGLSDSFYSFGTSRTVVVHEIVRGNWTWCTAWSHDGSRLAVATENHHLAIVDTSSSTVWRVKHDRRITNPIKNDTTHSIRCIAWGSQFIAVGGTGNAVSILSPIEPYPILHTIKGTGFVGCLDWRLNSAILCIGSREDKCLIVRVSAAGDEERARRIVSSVLYTINTKDWVNAVAFSPGGTVLAIGDRSGLLTVFGFETAMEPSQYKLSKITNLLLEDSILTIEWSHDGTWLYAGGEDFAISIIDTSSWKIKQKVKRERWVQFIASSNRGTHLAVGGVASEVSILDVTDGWREAMNIELKGLVPLSARWHPKDQFLALTGQSDSVLAIETTNARHVRGHYLQSTAPVVAVDFSPDGQFVVVGNEAGIITAYRCSGTSFITNYELVLSDGASQSIVWSHSGEFCVIGSGETLVIISKRDFDESKVPPRTSGFGVKKVIRDVNIINSISIENTSRYVAVAGAKTWVLDATNDEFSCVKELDEGMVYASAWSPDGTWLATVGSSQKLSIFDTSSELANDWSVIFSLECDQAGKALAWGPSVVDGLQYLAYGGRDSKVTVIEIRTYEGTWETVLQVKREGEINDLDWNNNGMLAVGVGDGTVTIIDLAYLQSGMAVNEMDYNWQRQGITCFTEIRRNRGTNCMSAVRWIPSTKSLLAIGGTDGALEVIDLTEREACKGFGS